MKKWIPLLCCLLALGLSLPAQAASLGEQATFEGPLQAGLVRVDRVSITRADGYTLLEVRYTLPDTLTDSERDALQQMVFCLLPDAASTDFPQAYVGGSVHAQDMALGAAAVAGASYIEKSQWQAMDALPDTLTLRPCFRSTGEWGEAITLRLTDGATDQLTDEASIPPPLFSTGGGNG